jgi:hypothetical protein
MSPNIPAQIIHYFLHAAANPGLSAVEIGRTLGMPKSASHRAYQALTETHWDNRTDRSGLGLLFSTPNSADPRLHAVYLTTRGRSLLEEDDKAAFGGTEVHGSDDSGAAEQRNTEEGPRGGPHMTEDQARLAALDTAIEQGLADIESGRTNDLEDVRTHVIARLRNHE